MEQYLNNKNFTKQYFDDNSNYYLKHCDENNNTVIYLKNNAYKTYLKSMYNLEITEQPDEAFLIINNNKHCIKLIEHKYLNRYSDKTPLKTGSTNKELYDIDLNNDTDKFNIELSYSINNYINYRLNSDDIEFRNIKKILSQLNINLFNSENENYCDTLYEWICN